MENIEENKNQDTRSCHNNTARRGFHRGRGNQNQRRRTNQEQRGGHPGGNNPSSGILSFRFGSGLVLNGALGSREKIDTSGARPRTDRGFQQSSNANQTMDSNRGRGSYRGAACGRGSRRGSNGNRTRKQPAVTVPWLRDLQQLEPNDLLFQLLSRKEELQRALEEGQDDHFVHLLVRVLSRMCNSTLSENKIQILSMLIGSHFLRQCQRVLFRCQLNEDLEGWTPSYEETVDLCKDSLGLFFELTKVMPSTIWEVPMDGLKLAIGTLKATDCDQLMLKLGELESLRNISARENTKEKDKRGTKPPEHYRSLPVMPTSTELRGKDPPFLRPIKLSGKYEDVDTYLDIQYRLFREDFVAPLREAIVEIVDNIPWKLRNQRVRTYNQVKVLTPVLSPSGLAYRLQFDNSRLQHVKWKYSKRLIHGTLLCLSTNNFKDVVFATVEHRDPHLLEDGFIDVMFMEEEFDVNEFWNQGVVHMIESPSYFEAYRHIAHAMLEGIDTVPFQHYIVNCKSRGQFPCYLRRHEGFPYDLKDALGYRGQGTATFPIVDSWRWPGVEDMDLNASQLDAFRHALTNELAVIQGPPGTGKTFLGQRIAHALLVNKALTQVESGSPILIVTYTNHALDQFLKGLLELGHRNFIRVGSRCKDESLFPFLLRNTQRDHKDQRIERLLGLLHVEYQEKRKLTEDIAIKEKYQMTALQKHRVGEVLPFEDLDSIIPDNAIDCFEKFHYRCVSLGISILELWLGLYPFSEMELSDIYLSRTKQDSKQHSGQLIDIVDEGEILRDRWGWEEDFMQQSTISKQRQSERRRNLKLFGPDGFEIILYNKKDKKAKVRKMISETNAFKLSQALDISDPFALSHVDRWRLYKFWLEQTKPTSEDYAAVKLEYNRCCRRIQEIQTDINRLILEKPEVIAMTTSCAARLRNTLEQIKPKILFVEEAAEVLEICVLVSLVPSLEHVILIGDHKQLKPSPSVYKLAKKYKLDVSLFERMVNNGLQLKSLTVQHRMRPEIAELVLPIYPYLENHESVLNFDNVRGVDKNVFFIDHREPETSDNDLQSKKNSHEAQFIRALCLYLIQQGYETSQITILTMYTGQLLEFRSLMSKEQFEGVRVVTVDNFQGEENDIILLSLVRSNEDHIGFVGVENRICVALSRAREGLFVIGNFDLYTRESELWERITSGLRMKGLIGKELRLNCWNHPKRSIQVSTAEDFRNAPEGGCLEPCGFRLDCGHGCDRVCHPKDPQHRDHVCKKTCPKVVCELNHKCMLMCHYGDECEPCRVPLEKVIPSCGHKHMIKCSKDPSLVTCKVPCEKLLPCGHKCTNLCGKDCMEKKCLERVGVKLACGHDVESYCYDDEECIVCSVPCKELLACGHQCKGSCGECLSGRVHRACEEICGRTLVCGHICKAGCTRECPPCEAECSSRCFHSQCKKKCGEPCTPCQETCVWKCPHAQCSKPCFEPCDREPCEEPCPKLLQCNHPCIGLCNERCPKLCRVCDPDKVEEIFFGTEDDPDARFIQLNDCAHIFEVSGLDTWMNQESGKNGTKVSIQVPTCPRCKKTISRSLRYGKVLKEMQRNVEVVKQKVKGLTASRTSYEVKEKYSFFNYCVGKGNDLPKQLYAAARAILDSMSSETLPRLVCDAENRLAFIDRALNCLKHMDVKVQTKLKCHRRLLANLKALLYSIRISGSNKLWKELSFQQLKEIDVELHRVDVYSAFLQTKLSLADKIPESYRVEFTQCYKKLKSGLSLPSEELEKIHQFLNNVRSSCGVGKLSEMEKQDIIKAIGLSAGHWFKCPNGHVYAIGECGGATEESVCPECKERIGGKEHKLLHSNTHAGDFDNSRHPAYSEAANMLNFNLRDMM